MIGLVVRASSSISSWVSSSPCSESCHSNPKSACGPNSPSCSISSRGDDAVHRPSSTRWVTSRSRYFGHITGCPASVSAAAPPSRSERISSLSRVISSGTRRSSSRSRTGQASAAERSAIAAWVRARSPKPCAASGPESAHSSDASATWAALSTACTCSTRRTAPATSSSSSASIRNEIDTRCGRSSRPRARIRAMRWRSSSLKSSGLRGSGAPPTGAGARCRDRPGEVRGMVSTTASSSPRTMPSAVASSKPSHARARASSAMRRSSSASSPATCQCRPSASGANRPEATSCSPISAAPASMATDGCTSGRSRTLPRTGSAPRIGMTIVRRSSVNSTEPSRGGWPTSSRAGPVTGTTLMQAPLGRTGNRDANASHRHGVPRAPGERPRRGRPGATSAWPRTLRRGDRRRRAGPGSDARRRTGCVSSTLPEAGPGLGGSWAGPRARPRRDPAHRKNNWVVVGRNQ